jgi:hypothetical protein
MKGMKMRAAALIATTILLAACATGAPTTVAFSAASPQALLIFGTASEPRQHYTVAFSTYDAANLRLSSTSFKGQHTVDHDASSASVQYRALLLPPGMYVVKSVTISRPYQSTIICLSQGTSGFDLKAGVVTYVGNMSLRNGDVVFTGFDDDAAAAALKEYPNVQGEPIRGNVAHVTFRNGTDAFGMGEVCGGYYVGELPKS